MVLPGVITKGRLWRCRCVCAPMKTNKDKSLQLIIKHEVMISLCERVSQMCYYVMITVELCDPPVSVRTAPGWDGNANVLRLNWAFDSISLSASVAPPMEEVLSVRINNATADPEEATSVKGFWRHHSQVSWLPYWMHGVSFPCEQSVWLTAVSDVFS